MSAKGLRENSQPILLLQKKIDLRATISEPPDKGVETLPPVFSANKDTQASLLLQGNGAANLILGNSGEDGTGDHPFLIAEQHL